MKPDAHMPFYGNDFFEAVSGYEDPVIVSYLKALWHYWHHTHCNGIPNDESYMRRICRCDVSLWKATRPIVFGVLFRLKGSLWHQDRCRAEYIRISTAYNNKVAAAAKARAADNIDDNNPDNRSVIERNQNQNQNQNDNQNQNQTVRRNGLRPATTCDPEWVEVLCRSSAYQGIDVKRELGKMQAWCSVRRKVPSRRRFVNWLNNCDKPLQVPQIPKYVGPNLG